MRSLGSISTRDVSFAVAAPGLAVENARKMSPELFSPLPPIRPTPSATRVATRLSWCGRSGASVATTTMIEPAPSSSSSLPRGVPEVADGAALHRGMFGSTDASAEALQRSRSGISRPTGTPDIPFGHRTALRGVEGGEDVLRLDVEAVDVVQEPVVGLGDHGQAPGLHVR